MKIKVIKKYSDLVLKKELNEDVIDLIEEYKKNGETLTAERANLIIKSGFAEIVLDDVDLFYNNDENNEDTVEKENSKEKKENRKKGKDNPPLSDEK